MARYNRPGRHPARKPPNKVSPTDMRSSRPHGDAVRILCERVRPDAILGDGSPCWALTAIAEQTRIPLAVRYVASPPSTADFLHLLHDLRKPLRDRADVRRGRGNAIPTKVCVDNGREFMSTAFADACHELGLTVIRTMTAPPALRAPGGSPGQNED